ncbi:MMPL family transporter [Actinomadura kijaniata]|uniref:MMPL family transporter n=1 Tax=Actinomadura kijaniata TaxID=46161 RepID=UPI0008338F19|nr:MMPL family transporter [Actinomadura kijaniata]
MRPNSWWTLPAGRTAKWWIVVVWLLLTVIAAAFAAQLHSVQRDEAVDFLPAGAQSTRVVAAEKQLPGGENAALLIVYDRPGGLTAADETAVRQRAAQLAARYRTGGGPPPQRSADGRALLVVLTFSKADFPPEKTVPQIRQAVADRPAGLTVRVTGPAAMQSDVGAVFKGVDGTLLIVTTVVVAALLILTYRSPFLWAVPLAAVGLATALAMAAVYGLVKAFGLTVSTQSASIMVVLVMGAGTDYALLLVARYREELRRHADRHEAMAAALRGAAPAVLASGATVTAGLLCLLAADMNNTRGLGPVGAAGIVCTLVAMLTVFPALLLVCGRGVFWPFVPRFGETDPNRAGLFARLGDAIGRRRGTAALGSLALLGALTAGMLAWPGDLKEGDAFTSEPEAVTGYQLLGERFPQMSAQPLTVIVDTSRARLALDTARATPGVAEARQGRSGDVRTEIQAFPKDRPESAGERATIQRLRDRLRAVGGDALVGGRSAEKLDEENANARDRQVVIPLVLVVVLLILAGLLRAVAAPLLVLGVVVLTYAAALGLGVLAFEHLFGFAGVDPTVPLLSFVFLVALGVDYAIFLMARVREDTLRYGSTADAVRGGVGAVGGVLVSAGVVLAATFLVLAVLPFAPMIQMGFVIAAGVLLATLLAQLVLVPAVSLLLGERVWWPARPAAAAPEAAEPLPLAVVPGDPVDR